VFGFGMAGQIFRENALHQHGWERFSGSFDSASVAVAPSASLKMTELRVSLDAGINA
jgi:hypothetical protein